MCGVPYLKRDLFVCFYHEQTSNGNIYLETLEKFASLQIQELQPHLIVQQDVASPSGSYLFDSSLTTFFPLRCVGRGGPINWPLQSPESTSCGFFVWDFVRDRVYKTKVSPCSRINLAFSNITNEMRHKSVV